MRPNFLQAREAVSSRWPDASARWIRYALLVLVGIELRGFLLPAWHYNQVDFGVYRAGGVALLHGANVYALRVGALGLPFTYPPIAAVLFAPFGWVAQRPAQVVWAVCSFVGLWYVVRLSLRRYATSAVAGNVVIGLGVFVLVAHSNPLKVGMSLGQINVFLALLILADLCWVFPRLPRGCMIGLAAALKLTPALLIVYLLLIRRYRAAAVAASTFLLVSLAAFACDPSASARYWFDGYFANARRTGDLAYISNQSLNGFFVRLTGGPNQAHVLWLLSAAATAVFVLWLAQRAHADRPWLGEALAMSAMLLISPVSWVHHWIIVLPLLVSSYRCCAEVAGRLRITLMGVTVALSVILLEGLVWWPPNTTAHEYHYDVAQFLLGNSQVLLLVAVVACVAVVVLRAEAPHAQRVRL